jgi:predicted GNAT family N-acyltransferase
LATIEIHPISAPETYQLRHQILRPHQPLSECAYHYDTAPGALHIGCFDNGRLIGVGSILPDPREDALQPTSWRIRGMAVLENERGTGAGGRILRALIDHARASSLPAEIWCNARANVAGFYEHFGFASKGDAFDLPGMGPHILMIQVLPASR